MQEYIYRQGTLHELYVVGNCNNVIKCRNKTSFPFRSGDDKSVKMFDMIKSLLEIMNYSLFILFFFALFEYIGPCRRKGPRTDQTLRITCQNRDFSNNGLVLVFILLTLNIFLTLF